MIWPAPVVLFTTDVREGPYVKTNRKSQWKTCVCMTLVCNFARGSKIIIIRDQDFHLPSSSMVTFLHSILKERFFNYKENGFSA